MADEREVVEALEQEAVDPGAGGAPSGDDGGGAVPPPVLPIVASVIPAAHPLS
jgi:hypothetical protein